MTADRHRHAQAESEAWDHAQAAAESARPKMMNPETRRWERLANELARSRVAIRACLDCGGPVVDGYCCHRCGSRNP